MVFPPCGLGLCCISLNVHCENQTSITPLLTSDPQVGGRFSPWSRALVLRPAYKFQPQAFVSFVGVQLVVNEVAAVSYCHSLITSACDAWYVLCLDNTVLLCRGVGWHVVGW
jgi:hypothetical protein